MRRTLFYTLLGIFSVMLLIALNASQRRVAAAELALTEGARSAVAEAAVELEELTLSLDKLLVTTSVRHSVRLLTQIALSADRVQVSLAQLPDTQGQRAAVLAYLSRLSHLCQTCLADLAEGDGLHEEARSDMSGMLAGLKLLQAEMNFARSDLLSGMELASALPASAVTAPPSAQELTGYKSLPSEEISSGEAMQLAKTFVGEERVRSVAHAPDTSGALPTYGVTVQTADVQLNLEITRRGGKVLLMAPETAFFRMTKSPEQCGAAALAFLKKHGFAEMEVTHYQVYDGLCVLTCVYVQNGVLIWPDRVSVQVRMDTAEVVGLEARSYWKNHIPRKLQRPLLTESEARAVLSGDVEVTGARMCLLPSGGQERMCWQFTITRDDQVYISYVDAMNGEDLLLEKVIQLEYGETTA